MMSAAPIHTFSDDRQRASLNEAHAARRRVSRPRPVGGCLS